MRALRTRHHHPFFRSGDLTEKSAREPRNPKREIHRVSVSAKRDADDRLDSWKEIASHFKRTVRTVQRWEKHEGLPVHRHLHQRANSVYTRKAELDKWWSHEANSAEIKPLEVSSEGSCREVTEPQVFTMRHSERGCREARSTPPECFIDCVLKLAEVEICSPEDRTGHVVAVLRVPCMCLSPSSLLLCLEKVQSLAPARWCGDASEAEGLGRKRPSNRRSGRTQYFRLERRRDSGWSATRK